MFGLEEFDALVLLDTDMAVVGDLSPLFALPVDFAAVWDQNQWLNRWVAGGWWLGTGSGAGAGGWG